MYLGLNPLTQGTVEATLTHTKSVHQQQQKEGSGTHLPTATDQEETVHRDPATLETKYE